LILNIFRRSPTFSVDSKVEIVDSQNFSSILNNFRRFSIFSVDSKVATLVVIIAALSIRVLEVFAEPAVFDTLPLLHQHLSRTSDVLMTGPILGGGRFHMSSQ
jgi:hypothetical protein